MSRRLREFIPDFKKDQEYWQKRQKNNEAAKRSREKRRINDVVMGRRIFELSSENKRLRLELEALKRQYGVPMTAEEVEAGARAVEPLVCADMSSGGDSDDSGSLSKSPGRAASLSSGHLTSAQLSTSSTVQRSNYPVVSCQGVICPASSRPRGYLAVVDSFL